VRDNIEDRLVARVGYRLLSTLYFLRFMRHLNDS
jgi:hypothetical protein